MAGLGPSGASWPALHGVNMLARNQGVSIVRAGRELELSQAWVNSYEPEERWWSVEVEFDPILDEIFGVVNNKQHAHAFVAGAGFDWEQAALPGETIGQLRERLV